MAEKHDVENQQNAVMQLQRPSASLAYNYAGEPKGCWKAGFAVQTQRILLIACVLTTILFLVFLGFWKFGDHGATTIRKLEAQIAGMKKKFQGAGEYVKKLHGKMNEQSQQMNMFPTGHFLKACLPEVEKAVQAMVDQVDAGKDGKYGRKHGDFPEDSPFYGLPCCIQQGDKGNTLSGVYTSKSGKRNLGQVPHALKMDLWLKSKKLAPATATDWKTVSALSLTAFTGLMATQEQLELFHADCEHKDHLIDTVTAFGGGYFWLAACLISVLASFALYCGWWKLLTNKMS